ncbi:MAG: carboxypeptidase-like regulatory domain-containing protein, partial [Flavisolibacter sp.]
MLSGIRLILLLTAYFIGFSSQAQVVIKGVVLDAVTKEPVTGASVQCHDAHCHAGCTTGDNGSFQMVCTDCKQLSVSFIGYQTSTVELSATQIIYLQPSASL